jgi:Fe-S-cluster containining protein
MDTPSDIPWPELLAAAARPEIAATLRDLFATLDAEIAALNPTCWISGKCCKFDSYGHRLYVTALEIAWLLPQLDAPSRLRLRDSHLPELDGCPFQVAGLCSVHALRPLGCRTYFCDPAAQHWQNPLYEKFLTALRQLHDAYAIPYRYLEWRTGLAEARVCASS